MSRVSAGATMPPAFTTMRHAAHDAVALVADGEKTAPGGGFFQHRHVAQQARERHQERARIRPARRDAGLRRRRRPAPSSAGCRIGRGSRAIVLMRLGQHLVVARQIAQLRFGFLVDIAEDSHGEMPATAGPASGNRTSKAMATAPRPFSRSIRSATSVRGHGHCPSARRLSSSISTMTTGFDGRNAGLEDLIEVEAAQPQVFDRRRIPDPQCDQAREHRKPDRPPHPEETDEARALPAFQSVGQFGELSKPFRAAQAKPRCRITFHGMRARADRTAA